MVMCCVHVLPAFSESLHICINATTVDAACSEIYRFKRIMPDELRLTCCQKQLIQTHDTSKLAASDVMPMCKIRVGDVPVHSM